MADSKADCKECCGTGQDSRMADQKPYKTILYKPCPACGGTGKQPEK